MERLTRIRSRRAGMVRVVVLPARVQLQAWSARTKRWLWCSPGHAARAARKGQRVRPVHIPAHRVLQRRKGGRWCFAAVA